MLKISDDKLTNIVYLIVLSGLVFTITFVCSWLYLISGKIGVVNFDEQIYGVLVLFFWLFITEAGLYIFFKKNQKSGLIVCIFATSFMFLTVVAAFFDFNNRKISLERDKEQPFLVEDEEEVYGVSFIEKAFQELSIKKDPNVIPLLFKILDDKSIDIEIRRNAVIALGNIAKPPVSDEIDVEKIIEYLTRAILEEELYDESVMAMQKISGDYDEN